MDALLMRIYFWYLPDLNTDLQNDLKMVRLNIAPQTKSSSGFLICICFGVFTYVLQFLIALEQTERCTVVCNVTGRGVGGCVIGEWSSWSTCSSTSPNSNSPHASPEGNGNCQGTRKRTRDVSEGCYAPKPTTSNSYDGLLITPVKPTDDSGKYK